MKKSNKKRGDRAGPLNPTLPNWVSEKSSLTSTLYVITIQNEKSVTIQINNKVNIISKVLIIKKSEKYPKLKKDLEVR